MAQKFFLVLAVIFGLFGALPAAAAATDTITLVADNWCPYNCEPKSEKPGFIIEIAQKAFARHNIKVEYDTLSWSRAIEDTRQGKYSAIVAASRSDAPDFVFPELPQGRMLNKFYVKKGNPWRYSGLESLKAVSIGVITDYSYNTEIDNYINLHRSDMQRVQLVSGDNALELNIKKLMAGRIGALLEGEYVMRYYLQQNALEDKVEEAGVLPYTLVDQLYIAFSPKLPKAKHYAEILSKEMVAMRKSGELKAILARYGVNDWE